MSVQNIGEYARGDGPIISPELREEIEHIATLPGFTAVNEDEIYRCATRFRDERFARGAIVDSMWKAGRPSHRRKSKPVGFVYFIEAEETGLIKIGHAANPNSRMESIQGMSPAKLRLIGYMPGSIADEKALHARFATDRSHGEWFRYSMQISDYIQEVCQ